MSATATTTAYSSLKTLKHKRSVKKFSITNPSNLQSLYDELALSSEAIGVYRAYPTKCTHSYLSLGMELYGNNPNLEAKYGLPRPLQFGDHSVAYGLHPIAEDKNNWPFYWFEVEVNSCCSDAQEESVIKEYMSCSLPSFSIESKPPMGYQFVAIYVLEIPFIYYSKLKFITESVFCPVGEIIKEESEFPQLEDTTKVDTLFRHFVLVDLNKKKVPKSHYKFVIDHNIVEVSCSLNTEIHAC
ncbi:unnamed protein product [Ambrosiozyma monospora]|uniref:Unnamed protein product n=1 Tax=Ambrosiozyma monospora TaxID=43982 RepID=A0ACB5SYZ2_AMBMO|nr:unnamed protein product [Ambrosiozyma monospora]